MTDELHLVGTKALLRALPKTQEEIVLAALRTKPLLSSDELVDCLYAHRPDGGPEGATQVVRMMIWRLRRMGVQIVSQYGRGYELKC